MSDFTLDPSVEEVLTLLTFEVKTYFIELAPVLTRRIIQDKFDVKDFVSSVSEKLIAQSKARPGRMLITLYPFLVCSFFYKLSIRNLSSRRLKLPLTYF